MKRDDPTRLRHMLEAAQEALDLAQGRTRGDLDSNRMLTLALTRCLEIVGEAARRVSDECRKAYPDIPWQNIAGMRNRLVHAYFDINLDVIWQTVADDLPVLITALERALKDTED